MTSEVKAMVRAIAAGLTLGGASPAGAAPAPIVVTGAGSLEGLTEEGLNVFRGIPYAAPPVGGLRWRAPQPVQPWSGVRQAREFGPQCLQGAPRPGQADAAPAAAQSEDCLTLNVWAPTKPAPQAWPVMVWIHGGAFRLGAGSLHLYDGAALARRGVIVVTINYRLGLFGTFAHPSLARADEPGGNYGLLDAMAALRWVQANIGAFGGDPARVTLFGESAGGVSTGYLMATPLARGLFARAIIQSGGLDLPELSRAKAEEVARGIGSALGADDAEALRALPGESLRDAHTSPADTMPFIDGTVVREKARTAFEAGRIAHIPLIMGSNDAEAGFFGPSFWQDLPMRLGAERFRRLSALTTGYGRTGEDAAAEQIASELFAGVNGRAMARAAAAAAAAAPTWVYRFAWLPEAERDARRGAIHTAEIPYVFGHVAERSGADAASRTLSSRLADRWTAFARTGSPELAPGDWPGFTAGASGPLLLIGPGRETVGPDPVEPLLDALDAVDLPAHP